MKKLLFGLLGLLGLLLCTKAYAGVITVDAFITPDDVSIAHLETFRSTVLDTLNGNIDSANIEDHTISEPDMADNANVRVYFKDAFNNFVASGLIPPTSASLTSTTSGGTAYINGYHVTKDDTSHTYTASKWTYIDLSQSGVYTYVETVHGAAEPSVTTNSMRMARVSTDGTTVLSIRDDRVLSIATATNEDHYRSGMTISVVTPDAITISPGVVYHGTTRLGKVTNTALNIGTASDWVDSVSQRTTNTGAFVVIDSNGNLKLTTTAPLYVDASGDTAGSPKRYSLINSNYYRVIAWFYMNATGSGNIDVYGFGNFKDGNTFNIVSRDSMLASTLASTGYDIIPETTIYFYSTGRPIVYNYGESFTQATGITDYYRILCVDSVGLASSELYGSTVAESNAGYHYYDTYYYKYEPAQGFKKIDLFYKVNANSRVLERRRLYIEEK